MRLRPLAAHQSSKLGRRVAGIQRTEGEPQQERARHPHWKELAGALQAQQTQAAVILCLLPLHGRHFGSVEAVGGAEKVEWGHELEEAVRSQAGPGGEGSLAVSLLREASANPWHYGELAGRGQQQAGP